MVGSFQNKPFSSTQNVLSKDDDQSLNRVNSDKPLLLTGKRRNEGTPEKISINSQNQSASYNFTGKKLNHLTP